jgi:hydrogenase nickel incorporation protein HypA/HybF
MHESSIMSDLGRKLETIAREHHAGHIVAVHLQVGALLPISAEHLREHFAQAMRGTLAEGARLDIDMRNEVNGPRAQAIQIEAIEVEDP